MSTRTDKIHEGSRRTTTDTVFQHHGGGGHQVSVQFSDNRPEALVQKELREPASSSPRAVEFRVSSDCAYQTEQQLWTWHRNQKMQH